MKRIIFCLISLCFIISCSTTKNISTNSSGDRNRSENISEEGSSYDNPVVIQEKSETTGVGAEYSWLRQKYPGSQTKGQSLNFYKKKPYDLITIITKEGKEITVYFDISNFYGKF